jgi:hypothetical protein
MNLMAADQYEELLRPAFRDDEKTVTSSARFSASSSARPRYGCCWAEASGRHAFKVNGEALPLRDTLVIGAHSGKSSSQSRRRS